MLDTGYWILDSRCWILDTGYLILVADSASPNINLKRLN